MKKSQPVCNLLPVVSLALALLLCLPLAAFAVTLDANGSDGYRGQYLLIQNINFDHSDAAVSVGHLTPYTERQAAALTGQLLASAEAQAVAAGLLTPQVSEPELEPLPWEELTALQASLNQSGAGIDANLATAVLEDTSTFKVNNFQTDALMTISGQLLYEGEYCRVYGETKASGDNSGSEDFYLTPAQGAELGQYFDEIVRDAMVANFGSYERLLSFSWLKDGKIILLCYDIRDSYPSTTSYYGGYFWSADLTTSKNSLAMLHIDTFPQFKFGNPKSTIVHEFQHLINYAMTSGYSDTWLNELCSLGAEEIFFGALTSRVTRLASSTVVKNGAMLVYDDYSENDNDVAANYSLPYLFGQYLRLQTQGLNGGGDAVFRSLNDQVQKNDGGSGAVLRALAALGYEQDLSFAELVRNFYLAMVLKQPAGPYGFAGEVAYDNIFLPSYTTAFLSSALYSGNSQLEAATLRPSAAIYFPLTEPLFRDGDAAGEIAFTAFSAVDLPLPELDYSSQSWGSHTTYSVGMTLADNSAAASRSTFLCLAYYEDGRLSRCEAQSYSQEAGESGSRFTVTLALPATAVSGSLRLFVWDLSGANIQPLCYATDLPL